MAFIDFDDVAYEDSVSSDTYDESEALWEYEDAFMAPDDSRDYELLDACDCAAEMLGVCYD